MPPFEIPVTYKRAGSVAYVRAVARIAASMNATSSTPRARGWPQQSPAFHARCNPSG